MIFSREGQRMKGILLDLDNTLINDRIASEKAMRVFLASYDLSLLGLSEQEAIHKWKALSLEHWSRYEAGELSFQDQRRARIRGLFNHDFSDDAADKIFQLYQEAYESAWCLAPDCEEFFELSKNIPKIIVTNGDKVQQWKKLRRMGLHKHVVHMVTPIDVGCWKPSPDIFRYALRWLALAADECLMIGDDPVRDIEPAAALGMHVFLTEIGHADKSLVRALIR